MSTLLTGIANSALTRINESLLVSINDEDERAERIRHLLPDICKEVLEMHHWNSATKRVIVSREAGGPFGEFAVKFAVPDDWVRQTSVIFTTEPETGQRQYGKHFNEWIVEGRHLLLGLNANESGDQVMMVYVAYDVEKAGGWSAQLRNCMAVMLASRLAVGTAGGIKLAEAFQGEFERSYNRATRLDTSSEGAYLDRYNPEDVDASVYSYSQLNGGASTSATHSGVGYCAVS